MSCCVLYDTTELDQWPLDQQKVLHGIHPDVNYEQDTVCLPGWQGVSYQSLIEKQQREGRLWVLGRPGDYPVENPVAQHVKRPVDQSRLLEGN